MLANKSVFISLSLKRLWQSRLDFGISALFFTLVVSIFGIVLTDKMTTMQGVGILWAGILLSTLLTADKLYLSDYSHGILAQHLLSPIPLSILLFFKIWMHWLVTGFPLLLLTPLMMVLLSIPFDLLPLLLLTLLIGTQILSAVTSLGALLTLGLPRAGLLLPVVLLPLYFPTLMLAMSVINNAVLGLPMHSSLAWLAVLWWVTQMSAPYLAAMILKVCLRNA